MVEKDHPNAALDLDADQQNAAGDGCTVRRLWPVMRTGLSSGASAKSEGSMQPVLSLLTRRLAPASTEPRVMAQARFFPVEIPRACCAPPQPLLGNEGLP